LTFPLATASGGATAQGERGKRRGLFISPPICRQPLLTLRLPSVSADVQLQELANAPECQTSDIFNKGFW
jgi:hypothetical protein